MPFVHLRWRGSAVDTATITAIRDALASAVAQLLTEADPDHIVTDPMVDLRVQEYGPLDRIRSDILVTVLARDEPQRQRARLSIPAQLAGLVREIAGDVDVVVELVLTQHTSSFDYTVLENA